MDYLKKIIGDIECHSVEGIQECFANGVGPNDQYNNEPLFNELTSEYGRTPRFKDCVRAFVDAGLTINERELLAVLSEDPKTLDGLLRQFPDIISRRYTLRCAYTPLYEATLLHVCAEFNHPLCARVLVNFGADVNVPAGTDENGFGGQTPVFHTVNQAGDHATQIMPYLLSQGADLQVTVKGLIWGKGYPWETFIPAVNPVSYAMMGLLPQMHRDEKRTALIVSELMKAAYGIDYISPNIPNAYLK